MEELQANRRGGGDVKGDGRGKEAAEGKCGRGCTCTQRTGQGRNRAGKHAHMKEAVLDSCNS